MSTHILRYGTNADQKYFSGELEQCYDMIAINAHMIAFSPNALALFVGKQTINKAFFTDPITHLFQHNQSFIEGINGDIKKSIANLIDKYALGLLPDDKDPQEKYVYIKEQIKSAKPDEGFRDNFIKNVIDYQKNFIKEKKAEEYSKYIQYAKEKDATLSNLEIHEKPSFFVAPYLFLEEVDSYLKKNIEFISASKSLYPKDKVYAQIVISKTILERELLNPERGDLENILKAYKASSADGYLVWIDNYSEHDSLAGSLKKYKEILSNLTSEGKEIYVLYGGYFSILLTHQDKKIIDGVSHGLEYGESREVVPVGGGVPVAKYYFYPLHRRINVKDIISLLRNLNIISKEEFFKKICDCPTCKEIIDSDDVISAFQLGYGQSKPSTFKRGNTLVTMSFATSESKDHSLRHYLYCKKREFEELRAKKYSDLINSLMESYEFYKKYFNTDLVGHLKEWSDAISERKTENK